MSNTNSTNNVPSGEIRKIKKIKRPIKRLIPGNPMTPASVSQQVAQRQSTPSQAPMQVNKPNANLDELLDSQLNLPALKNASNNPHYADENHSSSQSMEQPSYNRPNHFISDNDLAPAPRFIDDLMQGNLFTTKGVIVISILVFIFGILFTKVFFGGKTVVKDGLQGVVVNAEVPRGRARCGVAERTQGCVLYVMNPQRQDLQGRDFYDLASQLTGRQRFVIETGNMRYSSVKIRPGDIAQINIPPLQ